MMLHKLKEMRDRWRFVAGNMDSAFEFDRGNEYAFATCSEELDTLIQECKDFDAAACIPTSWCDPLLTGENAVIGDDPYDYKDIECLLSALRSRIAEQKEPSTEK